MPPGSYDPGGFSIVIFAKIVTQIQVLPHKII